MGSPLRDKPQIIRGRESGKRDEIDLLPWLLYTIRQGVYGMERTFEATIEKRDKWYIGWVDAVPGAFSQGRTVKEVEENLKEAVQLILESQRELRDKGTGGEILRRKFQVQV
jgi:predicted RNase H-like HicB family nuclease